MNVIRQPKRGGGSWLRGRGREHGASKSRGAGRGAANFDPILYRPGPRAVAGVSSSTSSGMKTPSNLLLQMAISGGSSRAEISSSNPQGPNRETTSSSDARSTLSSGPGTSGAFAVPSLFRTPSLSYKRQLSSTSSSSLGALPKTPKNAAFTPRSHGSGLGTPRFPRPTPPSTSSNSVDQNSSAIIVAITEGRGHARGEVGLAIIDMKRPKLILCQLSDRQTYSNTLTKINIFNPKEILVPHTFVDGNQPNRLYHVLEENFPQVSMTKVQRRLFKESEGMEKLQHLSIPENASCQILVKDKFYALAATAALLRYIEFVQNVMFASKSLSVEYQGAQHGTIIDVRTAQALELLLNQGSHTPDYTLVALLDSCCTTGGRRMLRASLLHPPCSLQIITHRQNSVQEFVENQELAQQIRTILKQIPDVEQLLTLCLQTPSTTGCNQSIETRVNYVLLLKSTLDVLPQLVKSLQGCHSHLHSKARGCFEDQRANQMRGRILETLNEDVKTPKGSKTATFQRCFAVRSGINDLLDVARKTYCELISDMHDHIIQLEAEHTLALKMNYSVTKGYHIVITPPRNRSVKESELPVIFLQVQRSRNSLSCTTDLLVHANERIKEITYQILEMSNTLLTILLNDIRKSISYLYDMCESIAELDLVLSLSQISSSHDYVRPMFDDFLKVRSSRHPILESVLSDNPVANDVDATSWSNLSIITGPNMSGKSIYIKQILVLQIMAQIGCYVPATEATFRITDRIFSHLNFDDSIENNASTLSLELQEVNLMLSSLTATSLVALDELCRGTSLEEGTALAWAICEHMSLATAFIFVTTHFGKLTSLASVYPCISNLHLETLEQTNAEGEITLKYTHRVKPGINPVKHYGLRLAESLKIPKSVIQDAWNMASQLGTGEQELVSTTEGDEVYTLYMACEKLKMLARKEDLTADDLRAAQVQIRADLAAAKARTEQQRQLEQERSKGAPGKEVTSKKSSPRITAPGRRLPIPPLSPILPLGPVRQGEGEGEGEDPLEGDFPGVDDQYPDVEGNEYHSREMDDSIVSFHLLGDSEDLCSTKSPTGSTVSWRRDGEELGSNSRGESEALLARNDVDCHSSLYASFDDSFNPCDAEDGDSNPCSSTASYQQSDITWLLTPKEPTDRNANASSPDPSVSGDESMFASVGSVCGSPSPKGSHSNSSFWGIESPFPSAEGSLDASYRRTETPCVDQDLKTQRKGTDYMEKIHNVSPYQDITSNSKRPAEDSGGTFSPIFTSIKRNKASPRHSLFEHALLTSTPKKLQASKLLMEGELSFQSPPRGEQDTKRCSDSLVDTPKGQEYNQEKYHGDCIVPKSALQTIADCYAFSASDDSD